MAHKAIKMTGMLPNGETQRQVVGAFDVS